MGGNMMSMKNSDTTLEMNILQRFARSYNAIEKDESCVEHDMTYVPDLVLTAIAGTIAGGMIGFENLPTDPNDWTFRDRLDVMVLLGGGMIGGGYLGYKTVPKISPVMRGLVYATMTEAGYQGKNAIAFSYGFLKESVKSLAQKFQLVKNKMEPAHAQEIQEDIDFLDKAMREFKDDDIMMVALKKFKSLSAEEYKSIKNNYEHLVEATMSKIKNEKEISTVFKDFSHGKVLEIIVAGRVAFQQQKIIDMIENDPKYKAAKDRWRDGFSAETLAQQLDIEGIEEPKSPQHK